MAVVGIKRRGKATAKKKIVQKLGKLKTEEQLAAFLKTHVKKTKRAVAKHGKQLRKKAIKKYSYGPIDPYSPRAAGKSAWKGGKKVR